MARAGVIDPGGLERLIAELRRCGYCVVGPTVRDGAIGYDELELAADLPVGWGDDHEAGTCRLRVRLRGRPGWETGSHWGSSATV